jgi:N-acetylglucosamine repressor
MNRRAQKATRKQTKAHNRRLVLKTIYDGGRISRADVARATDLTRTTVSDGVAWWIEKGFVEEVGFGPSAGGKPPILLRVVDDSHQVIGIDLASDEFRGAVVNLRGEIRERSTQPLNDRDGKAALALIYTLVSDLIAATDRPILGIGIGTPGLMDPIQGVVRRAVNLDWQDLPLRHLLKNRYGLPVHVANDSQLAALAEYTFGAENNADSLVVIKSDHGVGAGIVLNGQLFHGDSFGAGEIGHVTIVENGQPCRCGNVGCLETVASARAIVQQARTIARDNPGSPLRHFADNPERITIDTVCDALTQSGSVSGGEASADTAALADLVQQAARALGIAAANLVGVLSIKRILIAGSVTCFGSVLLDQVRATMLQRSLALVASETEVEISTMGPDMVILGASGLVLTQELGLFAP